MKRSRYVVKSKSDDGQHTLLYNIRTGRGLKFPRGLDVWNNDSLKPYLSKHKFMIQKDQQEDQEVLDDYKKVRRDSQTLHLIILPHENCNFRCVYCYENFEKNKMDPEVEEGIKNYIKHELSTGDYNLFTVSWFGGEPLLGIDVMERISDYAINLCNKLDIKYTAGITTNGSLITRKNLKKLCDMKVTKYQITIDGIKEIHDKQRVQANGKGTYDSIMKSLVLMHESDERFKVLIRMNVSPDNFKYANEHMDIMEKTFEKDPRFEMYFHNIGHWGGKNDENVEVCSENMMVHLLEQSSKRDLPTFSVNKLMAPDNVCYAANPKSFVIGTDGMLYKCTVALYDERNHIGKINADGTMDINEDRMKLWTDKGVEDQKCKSCFFAPSCHGDSCPLIRMQTQKQPCPDWKGDIPHLVKLLDIQADVFDEVKVKQEVT
ncbi:radical SAM/SPASM domain-containing protein [Alkalihalobacillus sp. AL-G]|uniref:radical SAM/SPASM domain-containing protein n=1 Tax=Alkalihalobacillus sp. AL-G TaxID=2926399 RepID=UPI00272AC8D6|nr:radical SAM protein [Alkalihalobacillus sp. AL-G]WLD93104.1 radical SAM protein [Alkalihalobacillus sp. AL-G]